MKRELNEIELEEVNGGTVVLSAPMNMVVFNGIHQSFSIKGDIKQMRNLLLDLYDANADMTDKEFDRLVKSEFKSRGWI